MRRMFRFLARIPRAFSYAVGSLRDTRVKADPTEEQERQQELTRVAVIRGILEYWLRRYF